MSVDYIVPTFTDFILLTILMSLLILMVMIGGLLFAGAKEMRFKHGDRVVVVRDKKDSNPAYNDSEYALNGWKGTIRRHASTKSEDEWIIDWDEEYQYRRGNLVWGWMIALDNGWDTQAN